MENPITTLNSKNYHEYVKKHFGKPIVILISRRKEPSIFYLSLSNKLKKKINFTYIQSSDPLAKRFKLKQFPKILILKDPLSYEGVVFDEEISRKKIILFINNNVFRKKFKMETGKILEFNKKRLDIGFCGKKDKNFCVLVILKD